MSNNEAKKVRFKQGDTEWSLSVPGVDAFNIKDMEASLVGCTHEEAEDLTYEMLRELGYVNGCGDLEVDYTLTRVEQEADRG